MEEVPWEVKNCIEFMYSDISTLKALSPFVSYDAKRLFDITVDSLERKANMMKNKLDIQF